MGCGRSTMESDSPSRNSKNDEEIGDPFEGENSSKTTPQQNSVPHPAIPFSPGGPLLAQAKASVSLVDFFKALDEKIDNGPDYDSESEAITEKSRLQLYLEQWNNITEAKSKEVGTEENVPLMNPSKSDYEYAATGIADDENDEWSDQEAHSHEVKEQYMFMGNVYTLTRLRSDGSQAHHVDISPAPNASEALDFKSSFVAIIQPGEGGLLKVNGTCPQGKEGAGRARKLQRADTPIHHTIPKTRVPPRPASLVLRTILSNQEET